MYDFGVHLQTPTPLSCDNTSAIKVVNNPVFQEHTKHIEVGAHFAQHYLAKTVTLSHVFSNEQIAYLFTKALPTHCFMFLVDKYILFDPL